MKNTLCFFASIGLLSLTACGEMQQKESKPIRQRPDGCIHLRCCSRARRTICLSKADGASDARRQHLQLGQRSALQLPGTFAITAPPTNAVRTPAEWENKQALLLAWTGNFGDVVADIIRSAKVTTDVTVAYDSNQALNDFKYQMQSRGVSINGVTTVQLPVQTLWMRDFGPLSVEQNGKMGFVDVRYYLVVFTMMPSLHFLPTSGTSTISGCPLISRAETL